MLRRTSCFFTIIVTLLVFLNGCSGDHFDNAEIKGTIKGSNEKVLPRTDVHLSLLGQNNIVRSIKTNSDGHFKITVKQPGLYRIRFTGVNHLPNETILNLQKSANININAYLSSSFTNMHLSNVLIIGTFNKFSYADAIPMKKKPDGTFAATVPADSGRLAYQIIGPNPNHPVNGTESDYYAYDGSGNYVSVIKTDSNKKLVVFDPRKLNPADLKPRLIITKGPKNIKDFSEAYQNLLSRQNQYMSAYNKFKNAGHDPGSFSYNWDNDLEDIAAKIDHSNDTQVKQLLLLSYMDLGLYGAQNQNPKYAKELLKSTPATSPLWSIQPLDMIISVDATGKPKKYDSYLEDAKSRNSDRDVQATVLFYQLNKAYQSGNYQQAKGFYDQLTNKYSNSRFADLAQSQFAMNQKVAVGKSVPDFKVTSLTNPNVVYSSKNMLGKYYMIDFWATWCGPCIREMDNITQAYKKYNDKNFTVLSLSLDDSPKDVEKFRKERYKMPWHHAFLKGGFKNKIAKEFEVHAIPRPILVNPKGIIIATGIDLRGSNLEQTLSHYIINSKK